MEADISTRDDVNVLNDALLGVNQSLPRDNESIGNASPPPESDLQDAVSTWDNVSPSDFSTHAHHPANTLHIDDLHSVTDIDNDTLQFDANLSLDAKVPSTSSTQPHQEHQPSLTRNTTRRKRPRYSETSSSHHLHRLSRTASTSPSNEDEVPPGSDCFYVQAARLNPGALFFALDIPMTPFTIVFLFLIQTQLHLLMFFLLLLQCVTSALGVLFLLPLSILIMSHPKFRRLQYFWIFPAAMLVVGKLLIFAIVQWFWFDYGDLRGLLVLIGFEVYGVANLLCCLLICAKCVFVTSKRFIEFQRTEESDEADIDLGPEHMFSHHTSSKKVPSSHNAARPRHNSRMPQHQPMHDATSVESAIEDELSLPSTSFLGGPKTTDTPETFMMDDINLYEDPEDHFHTI